MFTRLSLVALLYRLLLFFSSHLDTRSWFALMGNCSPALSPVHHRTVQVMGSMGTWNEHISCMFHTCSNHLCAKSSGVAGCFFHQEYPHIPIPIPLMCSPSHLAKMASFDSTERSVLHPTSRVAQRQAVLKVTLSHMAGKEISLRGRWKTSTFGRVTSRIHRDPKHQFVGSSRCWFSGWIQGIPPLE